MNVHRNTHTSERVCDTVAAKARWSQRGRTGEKEEEQNPFVTCQEEANFFVCTLPLAEKRGGEGEKGGFLLLPFPSPHQA